MRHLLLALAALAAPALTAPLAAQSTDQAEAAINTRDLFAFTQRDPGVGARLSGMGGVGAGGIGDWSAVYSNPASIGFLRRSQAVGALGTFRVDNDVRTAGGVESDGVSRTTLNQLGFAAKVPTVRGSLVVGGGYHELGLYDRALPFGAAYQYEEGQIGEVTAAGAVAVAPGTMVGLSVSAVVGRYRSDLIETGFENLSTDVALRGINARVGVASEVAPGLRFGLALETPTLYDAEEERFEGFTVTDFFDYRLSTPWRFTMGSAYRPIPPVLLALDVALQNGAEARFRPTEEYVDTNDFVRRQARETVEIRMGTEVALGPVLARAGYALAQDPLRDIRPQGVDGLRQHLTAGVGVQAGPLAQVNLAYVHTRFDDGLFADAALEGVSRNRFTLGVQVRF